MRAPLILCAMLFLAGDGVSEQASRAYPTYIIRESGYVCFRLSLSRNSIGLILERRRRLYSTSE